MNHLRTRWHYHITWISLLIMIISASVGAAAGTIYSASYFRTHYTVNQPLPPSLPAPPPPSASEPAAAAAHIAYRFLPPTGNQGAIGQCQCFAFAHQYGYLFNRLHHSHKSFSCRFLYTLVTQGRNIGTYEDQYLPILANQGAVFHRTYDYPLPPYSPDRTVPSWVFPLALPHRYFLTTTIIQAGMGGTADTLAAIDSAIAHGNPVNLDTPVFDGPNSHGFFAANANGNTIDLPGPGSSLAGGHATTIVAYNRTLSLRGVTGWYLIENSWSSHWGQNGFAWVSRRYVQQYGFGLEVLHLTRITPRGTPPQGTPPPPWSGMMHHINPPPPGLRPTARPPMRSSWYVGNVYARDARVNLGKLANAAGDRYHIWPVGLLAIVASECGLNTHSLECDRWGIWPDWSFGACQVTVSTAGGFGVGYGTTSSAYYVRNYENSAQNCLFLAAKVLRSYADYTGLNFPSLAVAWNCGPGQPRWFLLYPTGECATNHAHFLQWYDWALQQIWHPGRRT